MGNRPTVSRIWISRLAFGYRISDWKQKKNLNYTEISIIFVIFFNFYALLYVALTSLLCPAIQDENKIGYLKINSNSNLILWTLCCGLISSNCIKQLWCHCVIKFWEISMECNPWNYGMCKNRKELVLISWIWYGKAKLYKKYMIYLFPKKR